MFISKETQEQKIIVKLKIQFCVFFLVFGRILAACRSSDTSVAIKKSKRNNKNRD